jgi:hypothetical protein
MKSTRLKSLLEKKEAIASSSATNITLHYDPQFTEIGEEGKPEFSFTISMSSVGGKEYFRTVASKEEEEKLAEAVRLEFRRTLRKFDSRVTELLQKYNINAR